MQGCHGTMKRVSAQQVISVTLAHSLHLHDAFFLNLVRKRGEEISITPPRQTDS